MQCSLYHINMDIPTKQIPHRTHHTCPITMRTQHVPNTVTTATTTMSTSCTWTTLNPITVSMRATTHSNHNDTDHEDIPKGSEHGHVESKYKGDEVRELEELIHNEDGMNWEGGYEGKTEGYKLRELKHDEDRRDECREYGSEYEERDKMHEHGELMYGPEYNMEANN